MGKYVTRSRPRSQSPDGLSGNDGAGDSSGVAAVAWAPAIAGLALSVLAACAPETMAADPAPVVVVSPETYATCTSFP